MLLSCFVPQPRFFFSRTTWERDEWQWRFPMRGSAIPSKTSSRLPRSASSARVTGLGHCAVSRFSRADLRAAAIPTYAIGAIVAANTL